MNALLYYCVSLLFISFHLILWEILKCIQSLFSFFFFFIHSLGVFCFFLLLVLVVLLWILGFTISTQNKLIPFSLCLSDDLISSWNFIQCDTNFPLLLLLWIHHIWTAVPFSDQFKDSNSPPSFLFLKTGQWDWLAPCS